MIDATNDWITGADRISKEHISKPIPKLPKKVIGHRTIFHYGVSLFGERQWKIVPSYSEKHKAYVYLYRRESLRENVILSAKLTMRKLLAPAISVCSLNLKTHHIKLFEKFKKIMVRNRLKTIENWNEKRQDK